MQLAAYIDDACPSIKLRDVGVHIWFVRGPFFARRLVRGPEFLLRERQKSNVAFVKGKAAVGQVWAEARDAVFDLGGEPSADVKTRADYEKLDTEFTRGLSWDEFERTRRYKAIWAAPLFRRERVVAVVSIDIMTSGVFAELERATVSDPRNPELEVVLAACERALSD